MGLNVGVTAKVLLFSVPRTAHSVRPVCSGPPAVSQDDSPCVFLSQSTTDGKFPPAQLHDTSSPHEGPRLSGDPAGVRVGAGALHHPRGAAGSLPGPPEAHHVHVGGECGLACVAPPPEEPVAPPHLAFHFKDQSRVITASFDLSLRVYVWNKETKPPVLKSCYHLLGGSHRWAR